MATLNCNWSITPTITADPGRQEVTVYAYPMGLKFKPDEARRFLDEFAARIAELAVKDADGVLHAEVSEA